MIFLSTGWFNFATDLHRLQGMNDENEKDGSDSNCSDNVSGSGAFRPTGAGSPKENSKNNNNSYPTPNISVGPPIQPPPHLLPYLYPHGIYNPVAPPLSLLHNPAMNPGLFLNAQLALAAQHPALFGHYSGHSPSSPLHNLKSHRFSPYSLPGLHQGSAFDAVTPGGQSNNSTSGPPERSLSSSPPLSQHNLNSPLGNPRPQSASPTHSLNESSAAFTPQVPFNNNNAERSKNGNHTIDNGNLMNNNNNSSNNNNKNSTTASELKSMEKMVNGLEVHQNQNGTSLPASSVSIRSVSSTDCETKKLNNLDQ